MLRYLAAVRGYDTGAFLSTMLQGIETKIGEPGSIRMTEYTTNSTFIFRSINIPVFQECSMHQFDTFVKFFTGSNGATVKSKF
jgi:hypothetical protein